MTRIRLKDLPAAARRKVRKALGKLGAETVIDPTVFPVPEEGGSPPAIPIGIAKARHRRKRHPGPTPEDLLWAEVSRRWPQAQREWPLVEGRRFRGDIAFPQERLVVEVDGFQHHGKYLTDFKRDRERQNLMTIAGWRILRFAAGDVPGDTQACCLLIAMALASQ